jgi:formylglycine-generating enzyme required for sulfatase activity
MKLRLIPAGKFLMGSPQTEMERLPPEGPQHEVTLTRPFYLGVYPVTQEEYRRLMGLNPSWFSAEGGGKDRVAEMDTSRFPVEEVTWNDTVAFCDRLSALAAEKKAGRVYRLPTEAEWEYACRAGTRTAFWWGDSASSRQANFNGNFPCSGAAKGPYLERTCRVGSYRANPWGLYDMHGNVWQWCADWFGEKSYGQEGNTDPEGPKDGKLRVLRGGSWVSYGKNCRAANRHWLAPGDRDGYSGFRVVCVVAQ